jgi:hypothetical protein
MYITRRMTSEGFWKVWLANFFRHCEERSDAAIQSLR